MKNKNKIDIVKHQNRLPKETKPPRKKFCMQTKFLSIEG